MDKLKALLISSIAFPMLVSGIGCKLSSTGDTTHSEIVGSFNEDNSVDNFGTGETGDGVSCVGVGGPDGEGGFLWKPASDKDGNLVILFPARFDKQFIAVYVEDLEGGVEEGSFAGFTNPDRQTWRFSRNGAEYTGVVRADLIVEECEWRVPEPSEVWD